MLSRTEERVESQLKLYGHGSILLNRFVCSYVQYLVCVSSLVIWSFVELSWLDWFVVPLWVDWFVIQRNQRTAA